MKLLVVDDDPICLEVLLSILHEEAHQTTTAADGSEAWDLFKGAKYDAVVCDWSMPVMDGLELCRRIRSVPRQPYPYIVLVTNRSGKVNYLEAMEAGADDFIEKPLDPDLLVTRLRVAERILNLRFEVSRLEGLLSICSYCKRIKDESGRWVGLEQYISGRSKASFSHCICEACYESRVQPMLEQLGFDPSTTSL